MLAVWYYTEGDVPCGPLPLAELLPLLSQMTDPQHVKVWRHGFDDWKPAGEVREVARHLPAVEGVTEVKRIESEPSGIGGWLGLLALGQVIGIPRQLMAVGQYLQGISADIWTRFPIALWGEMVMYAALIGLSIYTTWLLFSHSRRFPGFFLAQMVCVIFFPVVDLFWAATIFSVSLDQPMSKFLTVEPLEGGKMVVTAIVSLIWISYVLRSRRVANTFTK
ncbi:hypothetical protein CQ12_33265 [Bradyrhizobium jicamae]|uniref:GYF domain-containing protein n=1 Tax=Bradyrhizobium jicamae TaxID=280332 RepID=A0A0R3M4G6_9BRAD|nr:DUF2569 family protein [Bradyrhizobium jicamae]KRR14510.1 hypothetical protein CQ12_33265 [Bradyrhizobium jicamae]